MITSLQTVLLQLSNVKGFDLLQIAKDDLNEIINETIRVWSSDHPTGHGFDSSDMTFLIKNVIDDSINFVGANLCTFFDPFLTVGEK